MDKNKLSKENMIKILLFLTMYMSAGSGIVSFVTTGNLKFLVAGILNWIIQVVGVAIIYSIFYMIWKTIKRLGVKE